MPRNEIAAVGELAGQALSAGEGLIRDLHHAIAERAFAGVGVAAAPVKLIHDRVADAVHDGVGRALGVAAVAIGQAAPEGTMPLPAKAILNGFYGDRLDTELALEMTIREPGYARTGRLVVFIHGLCETDASWRFKGGPTYGERLHDDLGLTPLYVRYNTGLRVADNGRELARQLDQLIDSSPLPIQELVLVGHSMGGLVARSACHHGGNWTSAVTDVVCLGTPHLGADLEKGANALSWVLAQVPETVGLSKVINSRSTGIKDLRRGLSLEEVPCLQSASYHYIGATLDPPLGTVFGDMLVRMSSASCGGECVELAGLNHFDLLNHDAVYEQLIKWLKAGPHVARPPAAHAPPGGAAHVPPRTT